MTHWGWYWRIKRNYKPKAICSKWREIDSFDMFKHQESIRYVKESENRIIFSTAQYNLKATIQDDNSLEVHFDGGHYVIPMEQKTCNYGGFYWFFHCPKCKTRIRKLYCIQGRYICRKCARLGYYTQRLRPSTRNMVMSIKIKDYMKKHGGTLDRKPPWMKQHTFQRLRLKYIKYDRQGFYATNKELLEWYGSKIEPHLESYYFSSDRLEGYSD